MKFCTTATVYIIAAKSVLVFRLKIKIYNIWVTMAMFYKCAAIFISYPEKSQIKHNIDEHDCRFLLSLPFFM